MKTTVINNTINGPAEQITSSKTENQTYEQSKIRYENQTLHHDDQHGGHHALLSRESKTTVLNNTINGPAERTKSATNENQLSKKSKINYENQTLHHADQHGGCHTLLTREPKTTVINITINGPAEGTKSSKTENQTYEQSKIHYENQTLHHDDQHGGHHALLSRESKTTVLNNTINGPAERTKSATNENQLSKKSKINYENQTLHHDDQHGGHHAL